MSAACVWYVELRGAGALATLGDLLALLPTEPGFVGAELQLSPAQPGLALIASRWASQPPAIPVPDGAKHWAFEIMASL